MRIVKSIFFVLGAILLCATLSPVSRAGEEDRKTVVTFDQDTQIPGQVLPAGTYVFKLAKTESCREIVQIWNGDETQLLATLVTIVEYSAETPSKAYVLLDAHDHSSPPELLSWFYPGDSSGRAFIYPKNEREPSPEYQPELSRR